MALRALLLSPDDQAVHAITSVLEEMSVSCDRPLDGATAAKKLNSERFDLVLVDCENLPAAKLIFDVCRRSHGGTSVPVAIVDGRAGLPTAFRLGAELILTKPVAVDQARATVRTAVSRTRKEQPLQDAKPAELAPTGIVGERQENIAPKAMAAAAGAGLAPSVQTAVAVAATTPVLVQAPAPSSVVPTAATVSHETAPTISTSFHASAAATAAATAIEPVVTPAAAITSPDKQTVSEASTQAPSSEQQLSEDPVMAALENDEPTQTSSFSAFAEPRPERSRQLLLITLLLAMAGGAAYTGWMYQPGFRKFIDLRFEQGKTLLRLRTKGPVAAARSTAPAVPVKPPVQQAAPPSASSSAQPRSATGTSDTSTVNPSDQATSAIDTSTPSVTPATTLANSSASEPENKTATTDAPVSDLLEAKGAVILSSKGAEKRLLRRVAPVVLAGARGKSAEATVVLKALIDENGGVRAVQPVEGDGSLADAAIKAVKQWRYKPYTRDGKALPFQTIVLVDFQ